MEINRKIMYKLFTILAIIPFVTCTVKSPTINPGLLSPSQSIGECHSCKLFIDSFKNGLERTARGKYEGGDAAWEEEKLKKSYRRSEIRLVDIQEGICKEESKYSVQCHYMAEKAEEFIEEWWAENPDDSDNLFTYICIDKMKVCCPKHHYGPNCTPCPGDHENLCSGNGKCRGDGTRKGNGTCLCDPQYTGQECDQCAIGYYQSNKDGEKLYCSKCDRACLGGCQQGSQKDCVACKLGYIMDSEEGCIDVNECDELNRCTENQFCMNSIGSYICMNCDKACKGCYSDGPDTCIECAKGYSRKGEFCIKDTEDDDHGESLTTTRKEEL